jgi:GT2 family glycosyltransferase
MFGNNSIIRKAVVQKVGWYDERLRTNAEDFDLCRRMQRDGFGFIYDPSAIVSHLRQDTVRSILDTFWRYGRFDYFQQVNTIETLKRIRHQICRTSPKLLWKDWQAGRYELLGLDAALPLYTTYRDLQLLIHVSSAGAQAQKKP